MTHEQSKTVELEVASFGEGGRRQGKETICREMPLKIVVNSTEMATVLCSPADLKHLVLGLLYSESLIQNLSDVTGIEINTDAEEVCVNIKGTTDGRRAFQPLIASGGGKNASSALPDTIKPISTSLKVSPDAVAAIMEDFLNSSEVYSSTRGVHSAALAKNGKIIVFKDDIGRHNALDKVFGHCLESSISPEDGMIIISGRISSEMLLKVALRRVPVLMTKAVPTNMGIKMAGELGITLIRCLKNRRITVYTHEWRINQ